MTADDNNEVTLGGQELIRESFKAAQLLDRPRVDQLCATLAARIRRGEVDLPITVAEKLLGTLRRRRLLSPMQKVADALIQSGEDAPTVRRQYVQALIDHGALTAALSVLRELIGDTAGLAVENGEARGLLGRALKQQYVDAANPRSERSHEMLREAIATYYTAYREDTSRIWHGINAAACLARARRDGIIVDGHRSPGAIAGEILETMETFGASPGAWELATALEACVVLANEQQPVDRGWQYLARPEVDSPEQQALEWARRYVAHPDVDAFELTSTVRQLEEVWQLNATSGIGAAILPLLRNVLLRHQTGRVDVSSDEVGNSEQDLERVWGPESFVSLPWYRTGLSRARMVARIEDRKGNPFGTGFLVRGSDLAPALGERWVLLTNAHVVSNDPLDRALPTHDAVVTFDALAATPESGAAGFGVRSILWRSGPKELDTTVLELDWTEPQLDAEVACNIAGELPAAGMQERAYIIGHPDGRKLSFSLYDNEFLGHEDPLLHYRTQTKGGSSGSPIFNDDWELIGIHHAGYEQVRRLDGQPGTYSANEGIWIQAIRKAIDRDLAQQA